jgi:hypothetical protein
MTSSRPDPVRGREAIDRLARHDLRLVALIAFMIGVFLHACVVYAVLDDGGGGSEVESRPVIVQPTAAPTATRLADRTNCDDIRGTDYRSNAEREWFRANC